MKHFRLTAAMLFLAPVSQAAAQQQTVQQQFDAAASAFAANDWTGALRLYEALEARVTNPRNLAVIRARKAVVLVELGRAEEAVAALRIALPMLPASDATLNQDRFLGLEALGRVAETSLDYPEALRQYRLAIAIPLPDREKLTVYRGLIQTQLFTDAEAAVREADTALRILAATAPADRALEGQVRTLKGRALLNLGRHPEARGELEQALRLLGNLTLRADRADLLARSDLAIAALLVGNQEDARRYLAYTGAGRFLHGSIQVAETSELPQCGPDIAPDDVAVIEAYVTDTGRVASARPIYASRQGPSAIALARAVSHWSFDPAQARSVPLLMRSVVRFEVRCSNLPLRSLTGSSDSDLRRLAAADPLWRELIETHRYRAAEALRIALATQERAPRPDPRRVLPLLMLLGASAELERSEREAILRRAVPLAIATGAPPAVIAGIAIEATLAQMAQPSSGRVIADAYRRIIAMPELASSPAAMAYVRLAEARFLLNWDDGDPAAAIATATEVAAQPEAARDRQLRNEALEILVAAHAARDEMTQARAAFDTMGSDAARCGLSPRQRGLPGHDSDFPNDAMRWGFEGWAYSEVSATPDGDGFGSRTVIAYPPFVFGTAARGITDRSRFVRSFTLDGAPCVIRRLGVGFRLAR